MFIGRSNLLMNIFFVIIPCLCSSQVKLNLVELNSKNILISNEIKVFTKSQYYRTITDTLGLFEIKENLVEIDSISISLLDREYYVYPENIIDNKIFIAVNDYLDTITLDSKSNLSPIMTYGNDRCKSYQSTQSIMNLMSTSSIVGKHIEKIHLFLSKSKKDFSGNKTSPNKRFRLIIHSVSNSVKTKDSIIFKSAIINVKSNEIGWNEIEIQPKLKISNSPWLGIEVQFLDYGFVLPCYYFYDEKNIENNWRVMEKKIITNKGLITNEWWEKVEINFDSDKKTDLLLLPLKVFFE